MMTNRIIIFTALLAALLLPSCSTRPESAKKETSLKPVSEVLSSTSIQGWEKVWKETLSAARKEGKVVLYMTGSATVRDALVKSFKEKYGIPVEAIIATGRELSEKLIREQKAGLYLADVYQGGVTTPIVTLKPAGVLAPLEPAFIFAEFNDAEIIKKTWWLGRLPWVDEEKKVFAFGAFPIPWVTINTELVKAEDLNSFKDLLNPKWKGKIIMFDPSMTGIGGKMFGAVAEFIMGMEYWKEFAKQEPLIVRDHRLLADWVTRGKYPIGFTARPGEVSEFRQAGAPLKMLARPVEGLPLTTGSGGLSLVNNTPHPNAAKIFINWILSKEGNTIRSQAEDTPSGRLDVPNDIFTPENLRQPGVKYIWIETEDYLRKEAQIIASAREVFNIR